MQMQVLISIIPLLALTNARLRGVSPQDESKYVPTANNKWSCLNNPEIVLDFSQVNDNYCDCPDGSDEPGSSLCNNGKFYCENEGHFPNFIPSFEVDDGVCDYESCCDGSDENGTVHCPNRCKELHEIYERDTREKERVVKNGLLKLSQLTKLAEEEKKQLLKELQNSEKQISDKRELLVYLEANYDPTTDEEQEPLLTQLSPQLERVNNLFASQVSKINELNNKIEKLESILEKLSKEYNPNFNDPAVKESIKNFQDYIVNKETETILDSDESVLHELTNAISGIELSPRELEVETQGGIVEWLHSMYNRFIGLELNSSPTSPNRTNNKKSSKQIDDLKQEIDSMQQEINSLSLELNSPNYGPNDVLRSYKDKCLTKQYGEYDYKYCFTGTINQQGHGSNVLIGKYSRFEDDGSMRLIYENGAKCWNGPIRQGIIEVECGEDDELVSVTEPEVCQYYFKVKSPIACTERQLSPPLRDEL